MLPTNAIRPMLLGFALFVVGVIPAPAIQADEAPTRNVFIGDWQVLGPFAKPNKDEGGTDVEFVPDEASLNPERNLSKIGHDVKWHPWQRGPVDFRQALKLEAKEAENVVGYAWTQFHSDQAGPATLSLGHDDAVAVWLNGQEVFRDDSASTSCYVDHHLIEVELQAGANTLLVKVGQGAGDWRAVARLLPAGAKEPLGVLRVAAPANPLFDILPDLKFDLLNSGGGALASLPCSGFLTQSDRQLAYRLFAAGEFEDADRVRVHGRIDRFKPIDQEFSMEEFRAGDATLQLQPGEPLRLRIVKAESGEPADNVLVRIEGESTTRPVDEQGVAAISDYPALLREVWVAAAGYEAKRVEVDPDADEQLVELKPGGHVLKGRVLSESGEPLAGAVVRCGWCGGYEPHAVTDGQGSFSVVGLPANSDNLYPTIVCEDYVAKDGFAQRLDADHETEVEFRLARGAVVSGRVVDKATSKPVAGVTVTAGADRFASNNVNPSVETDQDGRYTLRSVEAGQTIVHAFSDRYAPAMQPIAAHVDSPAQADFALEQGADVAGRVVDPAGKPIEGVWLITDAWNGARMFRREDHTDAEGRFRLRSMPTPPAEIHVLKQGYVSNRSFMGAPGESHELVLQPVLEHRVRVRLADADGPPGELSIQQGHKFPGRDQISWRSDAYLSRTYDAKTGVFTIGNGEPSTAEIHWRFRKPGYQDATVYIPFDAAEAREIDLVLERVPSTKGIVVDPNSGQPIAGAQVLLVNKQDRFRPDHYVEYAPITEHIDQFTGLKATTDEQGVFELPLGDSLQESSLVLLGPKGGFVYLENAEALLNSDPCRLPMPAACSVEGVLSGGGEPEPGAKVHLGWIPPGGDNESWDLPFGCGGQVTCDAAGRFKFEGLGPGRYRLSRVRAFDSPGRGGMSMYMSGEEVVVLPGESLQHDLARPVGKQINGVVLDPDGKPLGDSIVEATRVGDKRERLEAVRANAAGEFVMHHMPEGSYELSATHYSPVATSTCGLGDEDFTGRVTAKVPSDELVKLRMQRTTSNALAGDRPTLKGSVPPDFSATPLDGDEPLALSDQWGKVVAIDFWATWCGPCMAVMPQLKELHEKYKDNSDVVFITVSLDNDEAQLRKIMESQGLKFPVIYSGKGWGDSIAKSFGVTGIPSSFVIGRDGRFTADRMHGGQLAAAVEEAVKQPLDPQYAGGKPWRVAVSLSLGDDESAGVPGGSLRLVARDADGTVVRDDELTLPGETSRIVWLYPPTGEGGTVTATAEVEGCDSQEESTPASKEQGQLAFKFELKRAISGRVVASDGQPAAGVQVTARRQDGFQRNAAADNDGSFRVLVLPGSYYLSVAGDDKFAPVPTTASTVNQSSVEVEADADPEPVELPACRAVSLVGIVVDAAGEPVADADVIGSSDSRAKTDAQGRFELPAMPSEGECYLYATKDQVFGRIRRQCASSEPARIVLGEGMDGGGSGLIAGQKAPPLELQPLVPSSQATAWQPDAAQDVLLLFAALWRPDSQDLVRDARPWAQREGVQLQLVSLDWSADQARRAAAELEWEGSLWFGGPGGLKLSAPWTMQTPFGVLISPEGKVRRIMQSSDFQDAATKVSVK